MTTKTVLLYSCIVSAGIILCIEFVPEQIIITYKDDGYIKYGNSTVFRYGRRSKYLCNIDFELKRTVGNDLTINLLFNEYLHNEYRRSFVEMHFKLCDMLEHDKFVGRIFRMVNITCPIKAGVPYHIRNLSAPLDDFPYVFPFEKFRVDIEFIIAKENRTIAFAELYGKMVSNKPKNVKKKTT